MSQEKKSILFVCNHNSARSQIAEFLIRAKYKNEFEVQSAGLSPANGIHPLAKTVLEEVGIDTSEAKPKDFSQLTQSNFDFIVSVCEANAESCPPKIFGQVPMNLPIPDPAALADATEDSDEKIEHFRNARKELVWICDHVVNLAQQSSRERIRKDDAREVENQFQKKVGNKLRAHVAESLKIICPPDEELVCIQKSKLEVILRDHTNTLNRGGLIPALGWSGTLLLTVVASDDLSNFLGVSAAQWKVILVGAFLVSIFATAYYLWKQLTGVNRLNMVRNILSDVSRRKINLE